MTEIFLSFAAEDRPLAERLAAGLRTADLSVWLDAPGAKGPAFAPAWADALRKADAVLALWTPAAVASPLVRAEAHEATATTRLVNVVFEPDLAPSAVPGAFRTAPTLAIEDDTNDFTPIAEHLAQVASAASASQPTWTDDVTDDDDVLSTQLIARVNEDPLANWEGLAETREDGFLSKQRSAFAAAARKLVKSPDIEWRRALAMFAAPGHRLAALYRFEQLAEQNDSDVDWRRAIADLAWPYFPIRTLGQSVTAGAPSHELDAFASPYAADALHVERVGAPAATRPAGDHKDRDRPLFGGVFWLIAIVSGAAALLFLLSEVDRRNGADDLTSAPGAEPFQVASPAATATPTRGDDMGASPTDAATPNDAAPAAIGQTQNTAQGDPIDQSDHADPTQADPTQTGEQTDVPAIAPAPDSAAATSTDERVNADVADVANTGRNAATDPVEAPSQGPSDPIAAPAQPDLASSLDNRVVTSRPTNEQAPAASATPAPSTATTNANPLNGRSLGADIGPDIGAGQATPSAPTALATLAPAPERERILSIARENSVPTRMFAPGECALANPTTHTVVDRDTLWDISKQYYGPACGARSGDVYAANLSVFAVGGTGVRWRTTDDPNRLYAGERLAIPATDE